jgi:hypothetical protein
MITSSNHPDVFDNHVPARYHDRAPKLIKDDEGIERWVFEGMEVGSSGLNAVASWPKSEWSLDPIGIPEMRPGCYDVHERVRDMNAAGVWTSMSFPTMGGFSGRAFNDSVDKQLASAVIRPRSRVGPWEFGPRQAKELLLTGTRSMSMRLTS